MIRFIFIFSLFLVCTDINSQIDLEKIWSTYSYLPNTVPGFEFMNDGQHYSRLESNKIQKYDITTGDFVEEILNGSSLSGKNGFNGSVASYTFSHDEKYIIIESARQAIYRRSSKAYFHIYNRDNTELTSVRDGDKIMYASLSPDGTKAAYVFENNIYYYDLQNDKTVQITNDGLRNKIINGSADWVYEEEFHMSKAFFWSPDSKKIAFMRFDESEVPEFTLTDYQNNLYPVYNTFKYPKVGEKNSDVSVAIYCFESSKTIKVDFGTDKDFYIPRIKWTHDPNKIFVYHLNRHQNHLKVYSVNAKNAKKEQVIDEENKYYIGINDDIRFLEDNKYFIWSSEKSGFNHLYLHDMKGKEIRSLTSGEYDVSKFYGLDEINDRIYYQSSENSPLERQVSSVSLDGSTKSVLMSEEGTNECQFSSTFDYFVNTHSTINSPASYKVYSKDGSLIRKLEENIELKQVQINESVQNIEFFNFKTSENVSLNGYIIKPQNLTKDKKHPLLMYVYGGPGSQKVSNSWKGQDYWWFQLLSQQGYAIACVDNRGTGARGEEFKKMTYLNLGHYETIDQIEAAKYLGNLDFIDKDRISIFGWSYGGYMSTLCLLKGNDVFKAAIAVAPVTNWKWYDTIYTERYMRTEDENSDGYENNAPVNFAERLKGSYLLIHGMGDDNVHFQHTAEMANALIGANKQFDTYFYPNQSHGIRGGNSRLHLYQKMTDFLNENL